MKKLLLATTCLALTSTVSMAADMGMPYTKAPIAASAFSWTGCYAGAHVGGGNLTTNGINDLNSEGLLAATRTRTAPARSRAASSAVTTRTATGCSASKAKAIGPASSQPSSLHWGRYQSDHHRIHAEEQQRLHHCRARRHGLRPHADLRQGRLGLGQLQATGFTRFSDGFTDSDTAKGTLNGFLVGAGIEHALTHNWTVKAEYDFIGYGTKSLSNNFCTTSGACIPERFTVRSARTSRSSRSASTICSAFWSLIESFGDRRIATPSNAVPERSGAAFSFGLSKNSLSWLRSCDLKKRRFSVRRRFSSRSWQRTTASDCPTNRSFSPA